MLATACSGGSTEPAPPTSAPPPPTSAPPPTVVPAVTGTYVELTRADGTVAPYVRIDGDEPTTARPEGVSSLGTQDLPADAGDDAAQLSYFQVSERPAPFPTITLLGQGTCETRVSRELTVSIATVVEGASQASEDLRGRLLEIAPCPELAEPLYAAGGVPVVWHSLASSTTPATSALAALVADAETSAAGDQPPTAVTMIPLSAPDATVLLGTHQYLITHGAVAMELDGNFDGEILIGGRSYLLYEALDGPALQALDTMTSPEGAPQ